MFDRGDTVVNKLKSWMRRSFLFKSETELHFDQQFLSEQD